MDNLRGNTRDSDWNNTFLGIGEGKKIQAQADLEKAKALSLLANKPAQKMNPALLLIPVAGLVVFGIIFIVAKKRKK